MTGARPSRKRAGFVLFTLVITAAVILEFLGLAVDVGYLQLMKERVQTAADAAAIGGVQEIKLNGPANAAAAAVADAAANGFTNGVNSVTVTVNQPPLTGYYTGDSTAVEVIITQNVNVLFMSLLGFASMPVKARSVAHQAAGSGCVYVLDPSASGAFAVSNGVNVSLGCGLVVDSSSATALTASGGARLTASYINVAGAYQITNGATISPTPTTHVAAQSDPLSYLSPPSVGACTQTNYSLGGGSTKTINQGVYCGGITVSNGATMTMTAGTYTMLGGGFNLMGGATVTGTGVTIYLTGNSSHPYGPLSLSNGINVALTAPTTGSYAGILFYQDPTIASPAASTFSGGATSVLNGALYFPTSQVSYSNGVTAKYTILVAKTVSFTGGATFNADYSSLPAGSPVRGNATISE